MTYSVTTQKKYPSGWLPTGRQTLTYDQNNFYNGFVIETYIPLASVYSTLFGFLRTPTYAANNLDITQVVNQNWSSALPGWVNSTKSEYGNHSQFTSLGSSVERKPIRMYPNPTNASVTIASDLGGKVRMFNAVGQVVSEHTIQEQITINVLQKGIYIVELTENGQLPRTSRLIVQ
jgi:hypothetical protein